MQLLSIFTGNKNIKQTGLLDGMTDVHCHLLPGVDDGVQTEEESLSSLQDLQGMGVRRFFLTPHVMEEMSQNNRSFLQTCFDRFKVKVPAGIEVKLAAEYMLDAAFRSHMEEGLLTMGDRHVLVETSYLSAPPDMQTMLYEVVLNGYTPIIAHPERYIYMERDNYTLLKSTGYKLQLNLLSLSGFYGRRAYENSRYLLKSGMYDYTGSDFHNLDRHQRGLSDLSLDRAGQKELKRILDNNKGLW